MPTNILRLNNFDTIVCFVANNKIRTVPKTGNKVYILGVGVLLSYTIMEKNIAVNPSDDKSSFFFIEFFSTIKAAMTPANISQALVMIK